MNMSPQYTMAQVKGHQAAVVLACLKAIYPRGTPTPLTLPGRRCGHRGFKRTLDTRIISYLLIYITYLFKEKSFSV